jgi:GTP-binding protein
MAKPLVAVVGRPNVGKSTFFNKIAGRRIAIVKDTPGVTRDRIYADAEWLGHAFTLIDTGGIEPQSDDVLFKQMRVQAELAMDTADVILFFVDAKQGMVPQDMDVAHILRRTKKPVILVVNKADTQKDEQNAYDFYEMGIPEVYCISSEQSLGLGDLLDEVIKYFPKHDEEEEEETLKVAIVGKPNAGKSSLANKILGQERAIVSEIPGTTRDAVDTPFEKDGKKYLIIDTAGMRKKGRIDDETVERYSVIRSLAAVRRADVVIIMLDASEGITEQDVKIAGFVNEEGRPSVIAVNKWDIVEKDTHTVNEYKKRIYDELAFMAYVDVAFISAKTGQRTEKLLEMAGEAFANGARRISTGLLNDCISEAVRVTEPPSDKGRRLKLYYSTQVSVSPPAFVLFVNNPELMHFSYKRYLENYLRKTFDFKGTPIKIIVRQKGEQG